MIQLTVKQMSSIDNNLERFFGIGGVAIEVNEWVKLVEELPGVKSAEYLGGDYWSTHTLITFETEEDKTFFILKWS
jgi:hypothetical protein